MTDSKENIQKFVQNKGNIPLMKKMLDDGTITDINVVFDNGLSRNTALMFEAKWGTLEGVEFLLTHNADPNILYKNGWTVLHQMVESVSLDKKDENDKLDKLRLLLKYGADKSIKNKNGNTALDLAKVSKNCRNCVKVLSQGKNKTLRKKKPTRKTMRHKRKN